MLSYAYDHLYQRSFGFRRAILVTNVDLKKIEEAVKMILEAVGEDPNERRFTRYTETSIENVRRNVRRSYIKIQENILKQFLTKIMKN